MNCFWPIHCDSYNETLLPGLNFLYRTKVLWYSAVIRINSRTSSYKIRSKEYLGWLDEVSSQVEDSHLVRNYEWPLGTSRWKGGPRWGPVRNLWGAWKQVISQPHLCCSLGWYLHCSPGEILEQTTQLKDAWNPETQNLSNGKQVWSYPTNFSVICNTK